MAKEQVSIRLNPATIEVLHDVTENGVVKYAGDSRSDSIRAFIELLMNRFIYDALGDELLRQVMHAGMSHEQLCKIWLKYRRAERWESGYKMYRRTEKDGKTHQGKVVAIFGPDDLSK